VSAERLPRASEIAEAAEWLFGEPVHHTGTRVMGRRYFAKCVYWAALAQEGYSLREVARMVGADPHTVLNGLEHVDGSEHVEWVLDRAREIANENDDASSLAL